MLKLSVIMFFSGLLIFSCKSQKKVTKAAVPQTKIEITQSDSESGLQIIARNDCFTCHKMKERFLGPSFSEVAGKYEVIQENVDKLVLKIINGGNGSWGKIFMTPHSKLSKSDAELAVKYILSLKNKFHEKKFFNIILFCFDIWM